MDVRRDQAFFAASILILLLSGCVKPFWQQQEPLGPVAVFGDPDSASLGLSRDYTGKGSNPLPVCFLVDVDDATNRGRVVIDGFLDEITRIDGAIDEFYGANDTKGGGVGVDMPATGSMPKGAQVLPHVPALIAGWGNMTLDVDDRSIRDQDDGDNLSATFLVTDQGFQDEGGAIHDRQGGLFDPMRPEDVLTTPGDWEAHLVLESQTDSVFFTRLYYQNRDDGFGRITADENYFDERYFRFTHLGGVADLTISVATEALLPQTTTRLTFRFLDPSGGEVANATLQPTLAAGGATATQQVSFPLERIGTYSFTVTGPAYAATYNVSGNLSSGPFRLHFSWEKTLEDGSPHQAFDHCLSALRGGAPVSGNEQIAKPPKINLTVVVLGVLGTLVAILLLVKLVLDAVKIDEFRRTYRKK